MFFADELARQRHQDLLREVARRRPIAEAGRRRARTDRRGKPMRSRHERRALKALQPMTRPFRGRGGARRELEAAPLFRGLPERDLSLLARAADPIEFPEGDVIVDERRPLPQFVVLTSGVAEETLRGRRIGIVTPGGHFGELTLLEGEPQVPTVTALTPAKGFVLGRRQFWGLLHRSPALSMRLTASLAARLRSAQRRLADASGESVTRVVRLDHADAGATGR